MSKGKIQIRDTDPAKAEIALRRAATRAKKIAEETHTPLVVYEGGRVLKKFPGKRKEQVKEGNMPSSQDRR
ncbi:MAG: hypothetical protein AB1442_10710 [Nitrospirota bacterium]